MKRLTVDRVELRLKGGTRADARALGHELRTALPSALRQALLSGGGDAGQPLNAHLDSVKVGAPRTGTPGGIARNVSAKVAQSVRASTSSSHSAPTKDS